MLPVWVFLREGVRGARARHYLFYCAMRYAASYGLDSPCGLDARRGEKPEFARGDVRFSVSHSGGLWACAVHERDVGLDIQAENTRRTQAIARRFFCAPEIEYLRCNPQDFYRVWCAKEALVKWSGVGIARGFSRACVSDGDRLLDDVNGATLRFFSPAQGYSGCLCASRGAEWRLIFE